MIREIPGQRIDELSRPSRELLHLVKQMVDKKSLELGIDRSDFRFNRRDIREYTNWSDYQIKTHIKQLEELQYLLVVSGDRGRMYKYELAYEGREERKRFLVGLTDTQNLREECKTSRVKNLDLSYLH